ncbi:Stage II sporulation protein E (SpoIIE) [Phycisphaerae bacterium RAS2]|nr:Stage II sporulation protein E (SpoIIE) [Phycisphaerae bacterium RAS2]
MTVTLNANVDFWQQSWDPAGCGDVVIVEQVESVLRVALGDACGHGPRAAEWARSFEAMARPALRQPISVATFVEWNRRLFERSRVANFVAATVVEFDVSTGTCEVWNAGNPAPRLIRAAFGEESKVEEYGLPLGLMKDRYEPPTPVRLILKPADSLILLSDGLLDQHRGDERFGDDRVHSCLIDAAMRQVSMLEEIERALHVFRSFEAISDDITVVRIGMMGVSSEQSNQPEQLAA